MKIDKLRVSNDADEIESADWYVCVRASVPGHFTDDVYDFCTQCGEKVRHRPHGPRGVKKICVECAQPMIARQVEAGDTPEHVTSEVAWQEFKEVTKLKS